MDYIGINYYGREFISMKGAEIDPNIEYSESGRSISPNGFYNVVHMMHQRYNVQKHRQLPIWITENGIADATDVLRPSYIVEHLLVIAQCNLTFCDLILLVIREGIPFEGVAMLPLF